MDVHGSTSSLKLPIDSCVCVSEYFVGNEQRMRVPYEIMEVVVRPLQESELKGPVVKFGELVE